MVQRVEENSVLWHVSVNFASWFPYMQSLIDISMESEKFDLVKPWTFLQHFRLNGKSTLTCNFIDRGKENILNYSRGRSLPSQIVNIPRKPVHKHILMRSNIDSYLTPEFLNFHVSITVVPR